jgi:putative spermidine/putrescine transport system ATP-binding protein
MGNGRSEEKMFEKRNLILELRNLRKRYGDVLAVNGVSLDIREGEFLTLLGPSGSGKTTILLMIAGFEFPTGGDVILQGKAINFLPPEKRGVGLVFQNYALFPHMTIFDNIAFPLRMRKFKKQYIAKKVDEVLELVELRGYEKRYPKQMSGGQQQRIALARALVFDPPLLLLDEPLGALDKKLREHMQIELKHIHTRLNRTMIYVTHDQQEALVMSDRIAVMNKGEAEQVGTPDELYDKPVNKFVAGFIGESNFIEGIVVDKMDNRLTLQLDGGSSHSLIWEGSASRSEPISFFIRPEKMFIVAVTSPECCLTGMIEEVIYIGETRQYRVKISPGKAVNIREMNVRVGKGHQEGERIGISWHKESLRRI